MHVRSWAGTLVAILTLLPTADAAGRKYGMAGTLVDHTHNQHRNRRIYSNALQEYRDLYVYLPPGFDPSQQYPLMIWLHGLAEDEDPAATKICARVDQAICEGRLPPMIVAVPDGSRSGRGKFFRDSTFFLNSKMGCFEDYLEQDIWDFVTLHYPVRPEREAHVLAGYSGGGGAAYYHGMKYRERYGVLIGMIPSLNLRWVDCHGRYYSRFDPDCWGWREEIRPCKDIIGRFYGVVTFRMKHLVHPLWGRGPDAVAKLAEHNPIEMIDAYGIRPGEFAMYVAYGGKDEFKIDTQVESFLYVAKQRGLEVEVDIDPNGRHNTRELLRLWPAALEWLGPRLMPYSPERSCLE